MSDGSCLRALTFAVLLAWNALLLGMCMGNALPFFFLGFCSRHLFRQAFLETATTLSYLSLSFYPTLRFSSERGSLHDIVD